MHASVAAWNAKESLALPHYSPQAVEFIKQLNADFVILSDAYSLDNNLHGATSQALREAYSTLTVAGYKCTETEYEDEEKWRHNRNIMLLSRVAIRHATGITRLGTRNAVEALTAEGISIIGAHFDDRSERTRLRQAEAFIGSGADMLIGDLNNIHGSSLAARALGNVVARRVAHLVPHQRARSLATRATEMASGSALQVLEAAGYHDADNKRRPTYPARNPKLQLDHAVVSQNINVASFELRDPGQASDHLAIKLQIET